ncbi:unnamed protein product [Lota lota]
MSSPISEDAAPRGVSCAAVSGSMRSPPPVCGSGYLITSTKELQSHGNRETEEDHIGFPLEIRRDAPSPPFC